MCGYLAIYYKNKDRKVNIEELSNKINHRGPNYTGFLRMIRWNLHLKD